MTIPPCNQTGAAEWLIVTLFSYIVALVAWLAGAGWWSLLALPAVVVLRLALMNRKDALLPVRGRKRA